MDFDLTLESEQNLTEVRKNQEYYYYWNRIGISTGKSMNLKSKKKISFTEQFRRMYARKRIMFLHHFAFSLKIFFDYIFK